MNLCLDGRIRDTGQDEGDECARIFSKIFWRQPLLLFRFSERGYNRTGGFMGLELIDGDAIEYIIYVCQSKEPRTP